MDLYSYLEEVAKKLIAEKYYPAFNDIIFYKSGRAALSGLCKELAKKMTTPKILVPDYICNVVYRAARENNILPISYATNDQYNPNMQELARKIHKHHVQIVLLASIFGTQNNTEFLVGKIREISPKIFIVLDECQNLITNSPLSPDNRTVVVLSFNKNINGIMGGALCFKENFLHIRSTNQSLFCKSLLEIKIAGMIIKRFCCTCVKNYVSRKRPPNSYEYSHLNSIVYDLKPDRISWISLLLAVQGLKKIEDIENYRKENYYSVMKILSEFRLGHLIKTSRIENSYYLPVSGNTSELANHFPLKPPYAVDGSSLKSNKPQAYAIIQK
jgi:hypothetical protein